MLEYWEIFWHDWKALVQIQKQPSTEVKPTTNIHMLPFHLYPLKKLWRWKMQFTDTGYMCAPHSPIIALIRHWDAGIESLISFSYLVWKSRSGQDMDNLCLLSKLLQSLGYVQAEQSYYTKLVDFIYLTASVWLMSLMTGYCIAAWNDSSGVGRAVQRWVHSKRHWQAGDCLGRVWPTLLFSMSSTWGSEHFEEIEWC